MIAIPIAQAPNTAVLPEASDCPHARCRAMYAPQKIKAHVYKSVSVLLHTAAPESKISRSRCEESRGEKDSAHEMRAKGSSIASRNRASRLEGYSSVRT